MALKIITCSGANENTPIEPLVSLLQKYPRAELGIQVSGKKALFSTARYWWIEAMYEKLKNQETCAQIALHINSDWVERFCQDDIPDELKKWLSYKFKNEAPFIRRVQLNLKIGREKTPNMEKMLQAIEKCPQQRFIFSYCDENAEFIHEVHAKYKKFDLLFDTSYGEGKLPESYREPVFSDILQGYAGGLSPENVATQLSRIREAVGNGDFTIDAEGRLKGPDGHFCLSRCQSFLEITSNYD